MEKKKKESWFGFFFGGVLGTNMLRKAAALSSDAPKLHLCSGGAKKKKADFSDVYIGVWRKSQTSNLPTEQV